MLLTLPRAAFDSSALAALAAFCLLAACEGSGGEADTRDSGGGIVVLDTGGGGDGAADSQVCTPGERVCTDPQTPARCNDQGTGFKPTGLCQSPNVCEPETVTCRPKICEAGLPACASADGQVTCNDAGTGVLFDFAPCAEGQSCVGGEGCVPHKCAPGTIGCREGGVVARCSDDGQDWIREALCPTGQPCSLCVEAGVELSCEGRAEGLAPVEVACGEGEGCVEGEGCAPWVCTPGEGGCGKGGVAQVCAADGRGFEAAGDGCGTASCNDCVSLRAFVTCPNPGEQQPTPADLVTCPEGTACTGNIGCAVYKCTPGETTCKSPSVLDRCTADGQAFGSVPCHAYASCGASPGNGSDDGPDACLCEDTPGCPLVERCLTLPPPAPLLWEVPEAPELVLTARAGRVTGDVSRGFVHLAPVRDPFTGLAADVRLTPPPGGDSAWVEPGVTVGGQAVSLDCPPLLASPDARLDVALLISRRQTMGPVVERLPALITSMGQSLAQAGLDTRWALLAFSDDAPIAGGGLQDFTADLEATTTAVGALSISLVSDLAEDAPDAVQQALDELSWRPDAQRVVLLFMEEVMHDPTDNTGVTTTRLPDLLFALHGHATVHTFSEGDSHLSFLDKVHPDPRILACATGGISDGLDPLLDVSVSERPVVEALRHSRVCTFPLAAGVEEVRVSVSLSSGAHSLSASQTLAVAPPE